MSNLDTFLNNTRMNKILLIFTCLMFSAIISPSQAQKRPNWEFRCVDNNKIDTCHIEQQLYLQKKIKGQNKTIGRLLYAIVAKKKKPNGKGKYLIQLWLPLGSNLTSGTKIKVDEAHETDLQFLQCTKQGCLVAFNPTAKFIYAMKRGKKLKIFWVPFGGKQTFVADVALSGFTKQLKKLK